MPGCLVAASQAGEYKVDLVYCKLGLCCAEARSQAVEAQLASTTAELHQLKARQAHLELLLQGAKLTDHQAVQPQDTLVPALDCMQHV